MDPLYIYPSHLRQDLDCRKSKLDLGDANLHQNGLKCNTLISQGKEMYFLRYDESREELI